MGLQRDTFTVYVNGTDGKVTEHLATITHQDMLHGERALLGGNGESLDQAFALTTAWCWASLMRQQDYAGAWQQFRDLDCAGVERAGTVDVDPTQPATSDESP